MGYIKVGVTSLEGVLVPVTISLASNKHFLIAGASGSGKSILTLYILNQLIEYATDIYIADFKNSQDYKGITKHYATGSECVELFLEFYNRYQAIKNGEEKGKIWFLWDEMAGNLSWIESQNKKICQEIKQKLGEVLMMGRELAGGSAGIITVLQRADACNFMAGSGSRENYHTKILMGTSSTESRKMLGFNADELPKNLKCGIGKGLLLSSDNPFPTVFSVPKIDKCRLTLLLQKKANSNKIEP